MNYSLISEKLPYYLLFLCLFIIAQSLSMWGQFVTLPYKNLSIIIIQFCLILLINQFYLKQKVTRSDIVAFFIILLGFFVSFLHLVSKIFNIPVPEHPGTENPDTISSTLKSQLYNAVTVTKKGEPSLEYSKIEDVETQ